ncbi:MAG TPA: hypothetical protein PLB16_05735 [bacterium]|nr:hypothetical protein [bacterium]
MPKVKLNTITVTSASIQKEINELESLLEGRMDSDNFVINGAESASLGKSSFSDFADFGSPVYADKFFGTDPQVNTRYQPDFFNDIFIDLLNKSHDSNTYSIMTQKGTITLNYKNQINLEKPSVIVADTQMSLGEQQKAVDKYYADKKAAYEAWLAEQENNYTANPFAALASFVIGGVLGAVVGFLAGGPVGAGIGAVVGAGAGAGGYTGSVEMQNYSVRRFGFDYSYEAHKTNSQLVLFRHPPNYRIVTILEVIDRMNNLFKDDLNPPENVRYFNDFVESRRRDEAKYPAMAVRISVESKINKDTGGFETRIGMPFVINPELTGVWFSIVPHYPDTDLIESEDEYITALCEIDILFKEIT